MIDADNIKYFNYDQEDHGAKYSIRVIIEKIDATGAEASIEKWLGPHNYNGKRHKDVILMDADKVGELVRILEGYDLEGWSKLPTKCCSSGVSRTLCLHLNDGTKYYIGFNADFPKTIPPTEDIMYFELFNFFNGLIREAGWEEVVGEDLKDPRLNPAYTPRTVSWFGNQVKLKIGTGIFYEDGRNAEIDYEGKDWWVEEGFVGYYTGENGAHMSVEENGNISLFMDGENWQGSVGKKRIYKRHAEIGISCGDKSRWCELHTLKGENYDRIQIRCMPGPIPAPQFTPISINLNRCKDRFCRNCGCERKPTDIFCRSCGARIGYEGKSDPSPAPFTGIQIFGG